MLFFSTSLADLCGGWLSFSVSATTTTTTITSPHLTGQMATEFSCVARPLVGVDWPSLCLSCLEDGWMASSPLSATTRQKRQHTSTSSSTASKKIPVLFGCFAPFSLPTYLSMCCTGGGAMASFSGGDGSGGHSESSTTTTTTTANGCALRSPMCYLHT